MPGINAGVAAYKWGAYGIALRVWRPLAEQGVADESLCRSPGKKRRDSLAYESVPEVREFCFRCGHGFPPRGGCPRVYRKSY